MDEGAAQGVDRRLLGEPVDRAEAEQQRTRHEVGGPARGERPEHVDAVDGVDRSSAGEAGTGGLMPTNLGEATDSGRYAAPSAAPYPDPECRSDSLDA